MGGSGNWSTLTHWATTSGGSTFYGVVPGNTDDIVFDANSFSAPNQQVVMNVTANGRDFTCSNLPSSTYIIGTINLYGNLTLHSNLLGPYLGVNFKGTGSYNINSVGVPLGSLIFSTSGTYTLQDSLNCQYLYIYNGTFNANKKRIRCLAIGSTGGSTRTIKLDSSDIYLNGGSIYYHATSQFDNSGLTLTTSGTSFEILKPHDLRFNLTSVTLKNIHFYDDLYQYAYNQVTCSGTLTVTKNVIFEKGGSCIATTPDIHYLEFKENANINMGTGSVDSFICSGTAGGYTHNLSVLSTKTLTINQYFKIADGTCSKVNTISGISTGTLSKSSGTITLDFVKLYSMKVGGGATFIANDVIFDNGSNTGWTINLKAPSKYYWVGGTGNWEDATHWSLSSGGAGQSASGCIPSYIDSVFFDVHSFTAPGQSVTVTTTAIECKNMDWRGSLYSPKFTSNQYYPTLDIYGSLFIASGVDFINFKQYGPGNHPSSKITFRGAAGTHYISCGGTKLNFDQVEINANRLASYHLLDSFTMSPTFFGNAFFQLTKGSLYTHGYNLNAGEYVPFTAAPNNLSTLNLGTSRLIFRYGQIGSDSLTLVADSATLWVHNGLQLDRKNYSIKEIDMIGYGNLVPYKTTIKLLHFYNTGNITNYSSNDTNTIQKIIAETSVSFYTPVKVDSFYAQDTLGGLYYAFNNTRVVKVFSIHDGFCARPNVLSGNLKIDAGNVTLNYFNLNSCNVTGGYTYIANNCISNYGSNSGWTITYIPTNNYYWVGNSGAWNDPTHWAFSDGGAPQASGGCVPTANDSVFFTSNSFTADNLVVSPSTFTTACKNLQVRNVIGMPTFNFGGMDIYGSLDLDTGIIVNSGFNMLADTGHHIIRTANSYFYGLTMNYTLANYT
ncbi:MAG: hypothetical protein HYZ42_13910, partial [Bacteroidetes bacterium]|nr:hypothetical protein [Bacteroidota bacterium]